MLSRSLFSLAVSLSSALVCCCATSIPTAAHNLDQPNVTNIGKRQDPTYFVTSYLDIANSVAFGEISCGGGLGEACVDQVAAAIQVALNNYMGVCQSWYTYGIGTPGEVLNYVEGRDNVNDVTAVIYYDNPTYLQGDFLEFFLVNWNSEAAAYQIADAMNSANVIQICITPVDWENSGYIVGSVPLFLGWNSQIYGLSNDQAINDYNYCN